MRIYVGNLSYATTDEELQNLFTKHGQVVSASVIMDRETGRSRGFGFVEMADDAQAIKAIETLHQTEFGGRTLTVNQAQPRNDKPRRSGGNFRTERGNPAGNSAKA
jgi:RNA recognition motif-containing protein